MAVLDWISVDVIDVLLVIKVVADQVFPVPPLPYAPLPTSALDGVQRFTLGQAFGKGEFDDLPAQCKVCVALRQGP